MSADDAMAFMEAADEAEFLDEEQRVKATEAAKKGKSAAGKSAADPKDKAKAKSPKEKGAPCLCCKLPRISGSRFCKGHDRNYAAMAAQAEGEFELDPDSDAVNEFNKAMQSDAVAAEEVNRFTQDNPINSALAKKSLIDWTAFKRRHGQRTSHVSSDRTKPFTEKAFEIRCTTKLGLSKKDAEEWWKEFDDDPRIDRDRGGFRGAKQLYLPVGRLVMRNKEQFVEDAQEEGSNTIRKPKDRSEGLSRSRCINTQPHLPMHSSISQLTSHHD